MTKEKFNSGYLFLYLHNLLKSYKKEEKHFYDSMTI